MSAYLENDRRNTPSTASPLSVPAVTLPEEIIEGWGSAILVDDPLWWVTRGAREG